MSDDTMTLVQAAELLKLTPRRVQQLAAEGYIPRPRKGRYHIVGAIQGYLEFLRSRLAALGGDDVEAFVAARARLTKERADLAEIERQRLVAELIPAADAQAAWDEIQRIARARLLTMPSALAPRIQRMTSAAEIRAAMEAEIHQALAELSGAKVTVNPHPAAVTTGAANNGE